MSKPDTDSNEPPSESEEIVRAEYEEPGLMNQADSLMSAGDQLADMLAASALGSSEALEPDLIGQRIGPYILRDKLGEGGFGIVYHAEQSEPVKRKVAVKVIKRGMDSQAIIRRFEAERQTLAMMDHPNIATVLDVGTTKEGRPYFAMELVRGLPVTDYCDHEKLDLSARLALFLDVCAAMQHAHQKGIIHRDVKPSNILVTVREGRPVVKMIDFGIAKALESDPELGSMLTTHGQLIGTPHYMSPEQARGGGTQIDTRSDIYGLGVVLYELLTGATPIDRDRFRQAGLAEIQRIIMEQEPLKPSSQVLTLKPEGVTKIQETRGQSQRETGQALRGDLDWVLMRALEKEPDRRYPSASSLAEDIQRHLRNEPVQAGPPSRLYVFRKLVRRNRLAFASSILILILLVSGVSVSTYLYLRERDTAKAERQARKETDAALAEASQAKARAESAEQQARADQNRAEDALAQSELDAARLRTVSDFIKLDLLEHSIASSRHGGDVTLLETLDAAAARIGNRFADRPLVEAEIHNTMTSAYRRLEEYPKALRHIQRADDILGEIRAPSDEFRVTIRLKLAWLLVKTGDPARAEKIIKDVLKIVDRHRNPTHGQTLLGRHNLVMAYTAQGRYESARVQGEENVAAMKRHLNTNHWLTREAMKKLALTYASLGRTNDAVAMMQSVLPLFVENGGEDDRGALEIMQELADLHHQAGRPVDAFKLHRKVFELAEARFSQQHRLAQRSAKTIVSLFEERGNEAKAQEWREKLVE